MIKKETINNILNLIIIILIICIILLICKKYIENFNSNYTINIVDGFVYINLENRDDRKKLILEELKKINVNDEKLHKVSGIYIPKNGHKGCIQSHLLALNIGKMNKWNLTAIIEDDAELTVEPKKFEEEIHNIFNELESKKINWDVLMLVTSNKEIDNTINYNHVEKLKHATTGIFYIVKNNYINKIIELFENCNYKMNYNKWGTDDTFEPNALDQRWNELIKKDNWYCSKLQLFKNRNIRSTINTRK